jgi:GNAT superfamily N-acetyltransferase
MIQITGCGSRTTAKPALLGKVSRTRWNTYFQRQKVIGNAASRSLPVILRTDHQRFDERELAGLLKEAGRDAAFDHSRLTTAMQNSLVMVAAFVPRWTFNRVIELNQIGRPFSVLDTISFHLRNRLWVCNDLVMVGVVRAVGDATLVATLHDVVVHPQFQRMGVGKALLKRVTRELYDRDIVDVGVIVHGPSGNKVELFFESCGFGDDTEHSVAMVLGKEAIKSFLLKKSKAMCLSSTSITLPE